jgi:hypothetical protein
MGKSNLNGVSANFRNQPPEAPISSSMWQGSGGQSSMAYEPDANAPVSKSFARTGNAPISKNFAAAQAAAKSAHRPKSSATQSVLRKSW